MFLLRTKQMWLYNGFGKTLRKFSVYVTFVIYNT